MTIRSGKIVGMGFKWTQCHQCWFQRREDECTTHHFVNLHATRSNLRNEDFKLKLNTEIINQFGLVTVTIARFFLIRWLSKILYPEHKKKFPIIFFYQWTVIIMSLYGCLTMSKASCSSWSTKAFEFCEKQYEKVIV